MKTVNKGMVAKQTSFCYPHFYERYKVSHHFMATQCTLRRFSNAKILPRVFELPWENINDKVNTNNLQQLKSFTIVTCVSAHVMFKVAGSHVERSHILKSSIPLHERHSSRWLKACVPTKGDEVSRDVVIFQYQGLLSWCEFDEAGILRAR